MKLYLVLLLAIVSTAFAGKVRSNRCKSGQTRDITKVVPITVNPPIIRFRRSSAQLRVANNANANRVVSSEGSNCEFQGSTLLTPARLGGVANPVNPVSVGTPVTVTVGANIINTITVLRFGEGCATLCYLVSQCTHYNFDFDQQTCSLFSSKPFLTQYDAVFSNDRFDLCGLKVVSSSATTANLFGAINDNAGVAIDGIVSREDCLFTQLPTLMEENVANEFECALTCLDLADQCNAYEFFADLKRCLYKRTSQADDAVFSTRGSVPASRNKNLKCGVKQ